MRHTREDLSRAISRVAAGDAAAFVQVYNATSLKLYGIVFRILGREDVADEVLQEVYLRIWQRARDFDPDRSSPITWLATIARNRALDERRRRSDASLDDVPDLNEIAGGEDIAGSFEHREEVARLIACLDQLEPDKRRILLAIYFNGLTRDDVARQMGVPSATVKTWVRRSLAQLKELLGP